MPLGFSFCQTLRGSYWLLAAPTQEGAIGFTIEAVAADVRAFARDKTWRLTGTVDAERIASKKPLDGTLVFRLFDERRLTYRFTFCADDGRRYEVSGQEEWSGLAPVESLTLLPATLYDDHGDEVARATLRFDLRSDWAPWLKSFRLRWSR